jgi:putative protein-disulfide isomerase
MAETTEQISRNKQTGKADLLEITYYTDPLCCWSWAMEPQWRKLQYLYARDISVRYCMGGLLPGWNNFHDSVNAVSRPVQMGPVWMHAMQLSGMPFNHTIWMRDPPSSSYLACIAVKCAGLQSPAAEEKYLRLLRESIMINGKNTTKQDGLLTIALELSKAMSLDVERFRSDLTNDNGLEAFKKDLQEVNYYNIKRFPSLVFKSKHGKAIMLAGYSNFDTLENALIQSGIPKRQRIIDTEAYKGYWHLLTEKELDEIR